jgi:hypothetical protein
MTQQRRRRSLPPTPSAFDSALLGQKEIKREYLKIEDLNIDPSYQRRLYEDRLARITTKFDPDLIQTIVVSKREDGTYWILDGQHRVESLRRLGKSVVLADVREGLTHQREAILFWLLNSGTSKPTSYEQFVARLAGEEPAAVAITKITEKNGYHVGRVAEDGGIQAVSALETVYNMGRLDKTLSILSTVWPMDRTARESNIILGMGQFLLTYDGLNSFDDGRVLTALDQITPSAILRRAKEVELETGRSFQRGQTVVVAFRDAYNGKMIRGQKPKRQLFGVPIVRWTKKRTTSSKHG